ncbi:uncharacterized protein LOC120723591 [Simochromis diagramma]|uniref:uncharacterized protein LOC120723591 n=1 Tax=Simochromis diagramma TaxID=43689 RepID=UPI001A7E7336|nr:uncharacterized protein LOC120723591 [Simochromis diagramma]XP_039871057.1 uncharacterized protein LOC120723591 [Simochromis diagramma]
MARAVAKEKLPRSSSADRCALDNEVPAFMFRPISAPACELLSPPPADASFQSKDTDKIMHPDLKNDHSSLDDEVTFFMCPTDVPLPPRPPPTAEVGLCRKRRYSTVFSVNDEEEHLMPKRMRLMSWDVSKSPAAEKEYVCFTCPEDKRSELPLSSLQGHPPSQVNNNDTDQCTILLPPEIPVPPPTAEVGLCRKRRYSTAFSVNDEEEHLMPKCMRLMSSDVPVSSVPPPADASFHAKDTDKIINPDLKNDRSSLDDDVTFFMCPSDVPLPPRPPPTAELGLCRKRRYSTAFSVNDEEEHLMPKRMRLMSWDVSKSPAAEKEYVCFTCPEDKRSELPLSSLQGHPPSQVNNNDTDQCTILLPPEIPVPPSPAPVGVLETVDFPFVDN